MQSTSVTVRTLVAPLLIRTRNDSCPILSARTSTNDPEICTWKYRLDPLIKIIVEKFFVDVIVAVHVNSNEKICVYVLIKFELELKILN